MRNVIVYLVGPPGVGKYTVGKLIAERLSAKLLDNHFWSNPIFEVAEPDGTPFPAGVWDRANDVLSAVLETVALFGPAERNYVFTHAVSDPGGHPLDWVIAGQLLWVAERRRASLLVVRLACGEAQLRERISSEGRRRRFKTTDTGKAHSLASLAPFPINQLGSRPEHQRSQCGGCGGSDRGGAHVPSASVAPVAPIPPVRRSARRQEAECQLPGGKPKGEIDPVADVWHVR